MVIVLLVVVVVVALWVISAYNRLVALKNQVTNAWKQIDVQLKRRHDLVPMLVSAVQGHAGYERGTLDAVVAARNRAMGASGPAAAGVAEGELAGAVRQVFALAEAYPELRAAESYLALQRGLTEVEDHLQNARRYYNAVVRDLNTRIEQFPSNLVARTAGIRPAEFFGLDDRAEAAVPSINLDRKA